MLSRISVSTSRLAASKYKTIALIPSKCTTQWRWYTAGTSGKELIHSRLKSDLKAAMKAKEKHRLQVIKGVLSDIQYAKMDSNTGSSFSIESNTDVATVIQRAIKRRNDSIQSYREGGRDDLASTEQEEANMLATYLPKQLTAEEIEHQALQVIERLDVSGIKSMGAVMREIGISPAQAPKSLVAEIVKKLLIYTGKKIK